MSWPVRQRGPHDCGVAALATVARVDYERAETAFIAAGANAARRGSTTSDIWDAASFLDLMAPTGPSARLRRLPRGSDPPDDSIVKVTRPGSGNWHWVARVGGRYWDPAVGWVVRPERATSYLCLALSCKKRKP